MIDICYHCHKVKEGVEIGAIFLCEEHKHLKQYQTKEKKKTFIKSRSKKRLKQESEYSKVRKEYLLSHEECEVCKQEGQVIQQATEIHHKKGRIDTLLTNKKHFLAVCNECHQFIELNPVWAKENGYSENRL